VRAYIFDVKTRRAKSEKNWYNLYSCPLTTEVWVGGKRGIKFLSPLLPRICARHRLIYLRVVSFSGRIISSRFKAHRGLTKTSTGFSCHLLSGTHRRGREWRTTHHTEWESDEWDGVRRDKGGRRGLRQGKNESQHWVLNPLVIFVQDVAQN